VSDPVDAPRKDAFTPLVNATFRAQTADREQGLRLLEIEEGRGSPDYEQFSLIFAPLDDATPEQGLYRLEHEAVGAFDIFLVPIAGDNGDVRYQAVFNRRLDQNTGDA
jgi:hypothetical protein